jgi:hypothetical protein
MSDDFESSVVLGFVLGAVAIAALAFFLFVFPHQRTDLDIDERRRRWREMFDHPVRNDVVVRRARFLDQLAPSHTLRHLNDVKAVSSYPEGTVPPRTMAAVGSTPGPECPRPWPQS